MLILQTELLKDVKVKKAKCKRLSLFKEGQRETQSDEAHMY